MEALFYWLLLIAGTVLGQETRTFDTLKTNRPAKLKIGSTDCKYAGVKDGCNNKYTKAKGLCPFDQTIGELLKNTNLKQITKDFIIPEKLYVEEFVFDTCNGKQEIQFKLKTKESYEIAARYLLLAAESSFVIGWKHTEADLTIEKIKIKVDGRTSIGNDHRVKFRMSKEFNRAESDISIPTKSVSVRDFLAKFNIDAAVFGPVSEEGETVGVFGEGMEKENVRLGLNSLNFRKPIIRGIFVPGRGFEIICKGSAAAPRLLNIGGSVFIIIQDFKKPDADAEQETYDTPVAVMFIDYRKQYAPDIIAALTGYLMPFNMGILQRRQSLCITVATRGMTFINNEEVRSRIEKFTPDKGIDVVEEGLHVMHYAQNSNNDIRDDEGKKIKKILFRIKVTKDAIRWTSPMRIETTMKQIASFVYPDRGIDQKAISPATKSAFDSILYKKTDRNIHIHFNLTEPVPVLYGGIVTLLNCTLVLTSPIRFFGYYDKYELSGFGKEVILDEQVDIEISETDKRTFVSAHSNIFNMIDIRNRTRASYMPEGYEIRFPLANSFPVEHLDYQAVFERRYILSFKGEANLGVGGPDFPKVEILYYITKKGNMGLKVGLLWRNTPFHAIVNTLYKKTLMQATWIKFVRAAFVFKKENSKHTFDRSTFQTADEQAPGFRHGIGILVEDFDLSACGTEEDKKSAFCDFLNIRFGATMAASLLGRMLPEKVRIESYLTGIKVEIGYRVFLKKITMRIETSEAGDRIVMKGDLHFRDKDLRFDALASIFVDGSNDIMLKMNGGTDSRKIFNLPYLEMIRTNMMMRLPAKYATTLEFISKLKVGTAKGRELEFIGGVNAKRQYLYLGPKPGTDKNEIFEFTSDRLYTYKPGLILRKILEAFGLPEAPSLLLGARFFDNCIMAYYSGDGKWEVPEGGFKMRSGFMFIGKLTLASRSIYKARCKLQNAPALRCTVDLPPTKYGPKRGSKREINSRTTLSMYYAENDVDVGPKLRVVFGLGGAVQTIFGYLETVGMEGPFVMTTEMKSKSTVAYSTEIRGDIYKEVKNATIELTAQGIGLPLSMDIKYTTDITQQAAANVGSGVKEALSKVQTDSKVGKDKAVSELTSIIEVYEKYNSSIVEKGLEMVNIQADIERNNEQLDRAIFDITEDCISSCKTVPIPGMEWKEDCIKTKGGKFMKCLSWDESKEKVVNVICLIKCEAKKSASSAEASKIIQESRLLLNRYKESKVLADNLNKLKAIVAEGKEIAEKTKEMIDEETDFEDKITQLLAQASDKTLATINQLKVEALVNDLNPPCLPFDIDFTLHTTPVIQYTGKHDICFNGEFYTNVGTRILRSSFPKVDALYKALEEAELRYSRINEIKKSTDRADKKMRTERKMDEKRSKIGAGSNPVYNAIEGQLEWTTERRMPCFTTQSDRTMMGFMHYSPWAVAERSHPFASYKPSESEIKYNPKSIKESGEPCHQARQVVGEYRDIIAGLKNVADNYKKGKDTLDLHKESVHRQLEDSLNDLSEMANSTNLTPNEVKNMFHWYYYTKSGMNRWLNGMANRVAQHNKLGLSFWRKEMKGFYGKDDIMEDLHEIAHNAYSRSNVERGMKRTTSKTLADVKKTIQALMMQDSNVTIEEAASTLQELHVAVEGLHKTTVSCF